MTTIAPVRDDHDSGDLAALGYPQELHRRLGGFASFAAGFSFVSILTTVFQLFAFGFSFGGPAFFWTWPIVFVGQFSVALVFAELSSRYPIAGSIYQWSRRMSNEVVGWYAGWLMMIGYIVSVAAIAIALQSVLPAVWSGFQIVGSDPSLASKSGATNAIIIGSICLVICTVISSVGVRLMSRITQIGVCCEIVGVIALVVLLFVHAKNSPAVLTHTNGVQGGGSYFWPFIISMLMAAYVMYGFDSAGELSEETRDPRRTAPKAIIRAMLASFVGGGLLLLAALLAAPSTTAKELSTVGLPYVVTSRLGETLGRILLADVAISIFSAALAIQASASRVMFSMARDGRLPFSRPLAKVDARTGTPIATGVVVSVLAIAVLFVNYGQAEVFTAVTGVSVVIVYLAYLMVTVPMLIRRVRGTMPDPIGDGDAPPFSLGRFGLPINIVAVAMGLFLLIDIGWPRESVYNPSGGKWYLHYFTLLFVGGAVVLGAISHLNIHRRDQRALAEAPLPAQRISGG